MRIRGNRGCAASQATLVAVALLTIVGAGILWSGSRRADPRSPKGAPEVAGIFASPTSYRSSASLSHLPLAFEPNLGQTDSTVKFISRGNRYGLFLTAQDAVLSLGGKAGTAVLKMHLQGADNDPVVSGVDRLVGVSNYYYGKDRKRWIAGVPNFARVCYSEVYPGIDLVYYGNQGRLEYDFVVRPGADARNLQLAITGAQHLEMDREGGLLVKTTAGDVRWNKPEVYQEINGTRQAVEGNFVVASNRVSFEIGAYDPSRELVIDPILSYATYIGGSGTELSPKVATDSGGNAYITGTTTSTDFPVPSGSSPTLKGPTDVFVTVLNPGGTALLYTTFLGGTQSETASGIFVDSGLNAYIAGTTNSTDFPVTSNAFQSTLKGTTNAFVTKLDSVGAVTYATYLGGSGVDTPSGVAADNASNVYVMGTTTSTDFPVTSGVLQGISKAANQFFVTKLTAPGSAAGTLVYSTYLGGSTPGNGQTQGGGIAVDSSGNAYITGGTDFTDMQVTNASQASVAGGVDVFVAKLNSTATTPPLYLTYLGGAGTDVGNSIAIDSSGNAYVTGTTNSANFPQGSTFGQAALGGSDAFVAKFNNPTSGNVSLTYSTYIGTAGTDTGAAIAVDSNQNAYVVGNTAADALFAKVSTTTTGAAGVLFQTNFGGSSTETGTGVALDINGNAWIVGETSSSSLPSINTGLFQTLSGPSDAFAARYAPRANLQLKVAASPNPVGAGNAVTFTYTITNTGPDVSSGASFVDSLGVLTGVNFTSATTSSGTCGTAQPAPGGGGAQIVTCTLGTINANGTATVTVVLTPISASSVSNSATLKDANTGAIVSAQGPSVPVDFYTLSVDPPSATVNAGDPATFTATLTPVGGQFPNSISLSCSNLPTGATCTFSGTPIKSIPNSSPVTSQLVINTTARPKTASVHPTAQFWYAMWLPLSAVAIVGAGSRRRRWAMWVGIMVIVVVLAMLGACGGSKSTTTTTGTPAGTYDITVSSSSGGVTVPPSTTPLTVRLVVN